MLKLISASKIYDSSGVTALRRIDLHVARGDYVSVTGASGSGKSTLMHILGLLDTLSALPLAIGGIPRSVRLARARAALLSVGLGDRMEHLPNALSGGQQQRVAIARAIITRPCVLLADEPTAGLDPVSAADVLALFDSLHECGHTIVLITHNPAAARRATRRLRLENGVLFNIQ